MDDKIYDITKEYPHMLRITAYKHGFDPNAIAKRARKKKLTFDVSDDSLQRSVRRSRSMISDYVRCNKFDLFVTFTFDPKKVNRYDLLSTYLKMQGWLHRQQHKFVDFKYVIVPERHKDGAIHFHALLAGYVGNLVKTRVIQNNKRVYNINSFTFGFTNAQFLDDDLDKTTAYLCKYITKDMELISNRRRYWCSKNLIKPVSYRNSVYELGLNPFMNHKHVVFESEYSVVYEVSKDLFR